MAELIALRAVRSCVRGNGRRCSIAQTAANSPGCPSLERDVLNCGQRTWLKRLAKVPYLS